MIQSIYIYMSELSSMLFKILTLIFLFFLALEVKCSKAQIWIKGGYWHSSSQFPVPKIDSAMFTHIMFAFAHINYSSYELSISSSDEPYFSTFTNIVKQKNPTVQTIVSIWAGDANSSNFFSIISQSSQRKSFIESSITSARRHGFEGLDLWFYPPNMGTNMTNTEKLFDEWRAAINSESRISSRTPLILIMTGHYSPVLDSMSYPVKSIQKNLNWVHVKAYDFHLPSRENFTGAHTALYDPSTGISTDYGIKEWMARGLPASKMVLGLAFHGFVWTLVNPKDDAIGAPARGPGITADGSMSYNSINGYIKSYGTTSVYNSTYVVNSCTIGSFWIVFDDVEAIRAKVAYAKDKGLLGYIVWQIPNDYNWVLSKAAAQEDDRDHRNKHHLLMILLTTGAAVILLTGTMIWYIWRRVPKSRGAVDINNDSQSNEAGGSTNAPNLEVFSFADIKAATNKFSFENKLGEGGYGPVYKGKLQKGQEIAVKRLSKTSKQGFEEFKNEVLLTAKLQHVNLVRVLGFCTEKEEQMLVYEYMSNKSLDFYIYDPIRRLLLDWEKRVHIIEGVTQGLLYLQEYSRLTVIHRDLKASNILLDNEMKPKISDFGIARTFQKNEFEASTDRIVGTYGYVPPEYVNHGIYSTKSDVYSFGVLVLQIISGKQNTCLHGPQENLNLSDYAFELWKEGNGMEFMDPSLNDTYSSCKLMRCMQIGLLCVQEDPADRPSMLEVLSMLKNETIAMNTPKRPAFSIKRDEDKENESRLRQVSCSINQTTITQVVGR